MELTVGVRVHLIRLQEWPEHDPDTRVEDYLVGWHRDRGAKRHKEFLCAGF